MLRSVLTAVLLGSLALIYACARESPQKHEIQTRDGIKVVHNFRGAGGKAEKSLDWREDLVIGGETAADDYVFVLPTEIIADAGGNIYVLDSRDCTVKAYDSRGKFIARIGRKGQGPGEFESPVGIDFHEDGSLLVGNWPGKIECFDPRGPYRKSLKMEPFVRFKPAPGGGFVFEKDITVGEDAEIRRVRRIVAEKPDQPPVPLYSQNQLPFRSIQNKDFRFDIPLYLRWDIASGGRLRVGTANLYEIREMTLDGRTSFAFTKDYDPLPVPANIQAAALQQVAGSRLPTMPVDSRDFKEHLKYFPVFKSITADEQGRTWVELFQVERQDRPKASTLFDVFSSDGVFLFSTDIGIDLAARPHFKNGNLYALRRDAKGYIEAVRYRLPAGL